MTHKSGRCLLGKFYAAAIELRQEEAGKNETSYFKEYMAEAVAYIEEHLQEEDLSIIATAAHVYLNSGFTGRIFKSTFYMTFKTVPGQKTYG